MTQLAPITLHDFQLQSDQDLRAALREHQSVIYVGETGSGKTVLASHIAAGAFRKRKRIVFGVHRKELLRQTSRTFARFGIPHGLIASGFGYDPFQTVYIASADTLRSRRHHLKCDLFLPDECHLWASDTRAEMIKEAKQHGARVIGLSATPERLDGRAMRPMFEALVPGPRAGWLIENGFLSDYRAFAPPNPGVKGLHTRGSEYIHAELDERFAKPSIIGDAIAVYKERAMGKRTMAFAYSRKHGKDITAYYNEAGVPAVYIDGDTPDNQRRQNILDFANGKAFILVSVNLAIEGFDLSAQIGRDVPVEAVSLQRPTQSLPMARQMVGRTLRMKPYPATLMDHVGLLAQHGYPEDEIEWSLDGREARKSGSGEKTIQTTQCGTCFYISKGTWTVCPSCKATRDIKSRAVEHVEGDLEEVLDRDFVKRQLQRERKDEEREAKSLEALIALGKSRNYANPVYWAKMKMQFRQNGKSGVYRAARG